MPSSIDINEIDDAHEQRHDYRRANGSPLVSDPNDPNKTLRYRRPSGYGKPLDDEAALTEWRIWKAMTGVARSRALQTKVAACKDDDRTEKHTLRDEAMDKGAANESADTGTGLHAMTARIEDTADVDFDPPDAYRPDLDAYVSCLATYGLVSEYVEVHMVNDAYRAAGTADRIYRTTMPLTDPNGQVWPAGTLFLADLKTGAKLDFSLPGYCVQCAIYADGMFYDIHTESRVPTPEINREWTLLVHLPVGKARCDLLWCSVTLGLQGAYLSYQVKEWRNAWKAGRDGHDAVPVAVPAPTEVTSIWAATAEEPSAEVMVEFVRERIRICGQHDKARERLSQRWPAGVPTPKQGLSDTLHLVKVLNLLDEIERDFRLPFSPDPRHKALLHK